MQWSARLEHLGMKCLGLRTSVRSPIHRKLHAYQPFDRPRPSSC